MSLRRRLRALVVSLATLALGAAALPALASAQLIPSGGDFQSTPGYTYQGSAGLLSSISAAPAGSPGDRYLETTYTALAGTSLLGLDAQETITSPTFTWSGATPQALAFTMQDRANLGALVGLNGGVNVTATLHNLTTGSSTQMSTQSITANDPNFETLNAPLSQQLLVNNDQYQIVVTESIAPLLQVVGGATIDLDNVYLNVTPATLPAPVIAANSPAITNVTSTGADAVATVDPGSSDTTVTVDYGTTTSYGSQITQTIAANSGPTAITLPISGLSPSTGYHAQIVASSAAGSVTSVDLPFTTSATPVNATPPVISSSALVGTPDERDATIGATVNTAGLSGSYYVQYGSSASYGSATSPQTLSASGANQQVSSEITGLTPGTTYHARAVVEDADGTTNGPDITFTTASAMPPTIGTPTFTPQNSTGTSVVLNAPIDPGSTDTQVSVSYGPTTSYGTTTPVQVVRANSGAQTVEFLITGLTGGTSYHFRVNATNSDGPTQGTDVIYTPTPSPTPAPGPISIVHLDQTSFTLDSSIDTGGQGGTYDMEYGTDPNSLTSTTPTQSLTATNGDQPITETLTGLTPGSTYYVRIIVDLAGGATSQSALFVVTTSSPVTQSPPTSPPVIETMAPVEQTTTSITLRTLVDPGALATEVYAEYGLTSDYGFRTSIVTVPAGSGPTEVTITIDGLTAGTQYHVQLVTVNADGTVHGKDLLLGTRRGRRVSSPGPSCIATYVSAPARTLALLRLPAGAEVTGRRALWVSFPRGTTNAARYRLSGGHLARASRRGFAVRLAQLRIGRTVRLSVTLPRSHRRATLRLGASITTLPCGARLGARRIAGSRVAVTVRSALGARRVTMTLPAGWTRPLAVRVLGTGATRSLRVLVSGRGLRIPGAGSPRIARHGRTVTVTGLGSRTTGVTLVFAAGGRRGRVVARITGSRGGTRTVRMTIAGRA